MAGSGDAALRRGGDAALTVENLVVEYRAGWRRRVHAVSDVSLDVLRGETLGIVGESGCGKSTLAKAILRLEAPRSGSVRLGAVDLLALRGERLRRMRPHLQLVFQDPLTSLNPRRTVRQILREPLRTWRRSARARWNELIDRALNAVGLDPRDAGDRRPRQLSGGQAQRIGIARALMLDPEILVCDEPVASLDVSVQAQILNLLADARDERGLTMIFVSHDLAVVRRVCDRIAVMYLGKLCEVGDAESLFSDPQHPYTRMLLDSVPRLDQAPTAPVARSAELPSAITPPPGCRFSTRCPRATDRCRSEEPVLREVAGRVVACHFPLSEPSVPDRPAELIGGKQ